MSDLPPLNAGEELSAGDQSDHVFAMQERLAEFGYFHDAADGLFGESTEDAVREFQRNYGLPEDGRVGPETWKALDRETVSYATTEATDATPGMLSEAGLWRWDGEQWQPADGAATPAEPDAEPEMSTEQFQEIIALTMRVNSSDMA